MRDGGTRAAERLATIAAQSNLGTKEKTKMSTFMRAKMQVQKVERFAGQDNLTMNAVCAPSYGEDGLHEDQTFAKFTPTAGVTMTITNPALIGKIEPGQKFYVDFIEAE